ncbi:MAG: aminotransferase class I/II-fold pyridoxal phosphate-dependent enzyme, partial [Spirochaetota bacterium]
MYHDSAMIGKISKRVASVERVGSRIMNTMEISLIKEGKRILKLLPYPKRDLPEDTIALAGKIITKQINAPSCGLLELREEICKTLFEETKVTLDPEDNVIVTNGGMHALTLTFNTLLDPGDEVLIFAPCYYFGGLIEL